MTDQREPVNRELLAETVRLFGTAIEYKGQVFNPAEVVVHTNGVTDARRVSLVWSVVNRWSRPDCAPTTEEADQLLGEIREMLTAKPDSGPITWKAEGVLSDGRTLDDIRAQFRREREGNWKAVVDSAAPHEPADCPNRVDVTALGTAADQAPQFVHGDCQWLRDRQGAESAEGGHDSVGPIPLGAQDQPVGDGSPWAGGNGPELVVPWRPYHNGVRIVGGSHANQRIAVPADGPRNRLHIRNEEYRLDTAPDGELIYRQANPTEPMSWPYPDGPELHSMSRQVVRAVCPCLHWAVAVRDFRTAPFPGGHHEQCDGHGNRKDER